MESSVNFSSLSLSVLGCIFSELKHAPKVVYIHQRRWASPYWPSCRFWGWSWVTFFLGGKGGNREILKRNRGIFFLKVFWAIYFWSPDNARFQENHLGFIPFLLAGAAISLPLCLLMVKCCGPTLSSPSRSYGFRMLPMCVTCLLVGPCWESPCGHGPHKTSRILIGLDLVWDEVLSTHVGRNFQAVISCVYTV